MSTRYLKIHPDLQQAVRKFPSFNVSGKNLWLMRLGLRLMPTPQITRDVFVEDIYISRGDRQEKIRLRVYRLSTVIGPTPVLLWIHGGGYVFGRPEMDEIGCAQFARELGITVVSVDYRLAPGHPFPSGLEDCYAALQWVYSHSNQLGIDAKRIAIGGASAGAGLAAGLAQLACDRSEIHPVFQLLIYPMLDDRTAICNGAGDAVYLAWTQKSNRFGWMSYLGKAYGAEPVPPYSVPARRADLKGLPPAWIGVGAEDLFVDEDVAYAQALQAGGVNCQLVVMPGAFHGFDMVAPETGVVQEFRASQIAALKKYLFPVDPERTL